MSNIINWADEESSSDEEDNNINNNTTNIKQEDNTSNVITDNNVSAPSVDKIITRKDNKNSNFKDRYNNQYVIIVDNVSFSASVDDIGNFFAKGGCNVRNVRPMKSKGKFEVTFEDEESYQLAFDANGFNFMKRSLQIFDKKDFYDKKPIRNTDQDDKWNKVPVDNKPKKILEKPKDITPVEAAPSVRPPLDIQPRTKPLEEIGKVEKAAAIFGEGKPRVEKLVEPVKPVSVNKDSTVKADLKIEDNEQINTVTEESSNVSTSNEPDVSNTKVDNKDNLSSKPYTNTNRDYIRRPYDRTTTGRINHRTVTNQSINKPADTSTNIIDQSEKVASVNAPNTHESTDSSNKPYRGRGGRFSDGRDGGRKSGREGERPNYERSEVTKDSSDRYTDRGGRQSSREGGRYASRDGDRATSGRQSGREGGRFNVRDKDSNRYSDNKSGRGGRGNDYPSRSQPLDEKHINGKIEEVTNDKKTLIDKKPIITDEIKSTQQKQVPKSVHRTTVFDKAISNAKNNSFGALDSEDDD
eukprot:CAMPEP_0196762276 /NCGR_PEP_ID=MMETSP1095-20130614/1683_1 /TAXON_ID=96789 ORGANISM="Chromulina nebulosa, Strain UTEXLB2642" /NCGR_SAMPLE_ID=MMETSP1095 /ASSEMBLY_ACC=CAM_ASM_000446 /LENGTH=524 /DNA_ID=CAMNT_0042112861 /DNA_START=31 /DNA_END=1605 /DNA_ORIENTATION=-